MIDKVISGGQIGADIAGLRAAKAFGVETGGHAPKGWRTLYGPNPNLAKYGLVEHGSSSYPPRTRENARNSDGTIRFAIDFNSAGERATLRETTAAGKPHFDVKIEAVDGEYRLSPPPSEAAKWIRINQVRTLNIAGNGKPEIEQPVYDYVTKLLRALS